MGILHSIAAGFLGRDAARAGGVSTAIVGLFSHFLVAFCIVTVYVLMSRVMPALRKQWVVCGIAFGVAAYFVMTWFVVPMSNAGNGTITFALPVDAGDDQRHPDPRVRRRIAGRVFRVARALTLIPDRLIPDPDP